MAKLEDLSYYIQMARRLSFLCSDRHRWRRRIEIGPATEDGNGGLSTGARWRER
jgi:hypothetical protein